MIYSAIASWHLAQCLALHRLAMHSASATTLFHRTPRVLIGGWKKNSRSTSRFLPTLVPLTNLKILCRKKEVLLSLWVGWNGRKRRNPSNRFLCVESVWVIKQSLSWIKIHRLKPQEFTSTPTAGSSLEEGESPKDSLSPLRGWRFSSPNLWTCNFAECQNHQKFCWRLYLQP